MSYIDINLGSLYALANQLKFQLNSHIEDVIEHGVEDSESLVTTRDAADTLSLRVLTNELTFKYDRHEKDAELGAPVFHVGTEASDHSLADLTDVSTTAEIKARLDAIKAAYNGHDADASAHTTGSFYQVLADSQSSVCIRYFEVLKNLFPRGRLWQWLPNQPVLSELVKSLSYEFCRIEERITTSLREMDPSQADETLDEWKQDYRVPDECTPSGFSDLELRDQVVQKYTVEGSLSASFLESIIAQYGITVVISDTRPFLAGSSAGDFLTNYREDSFIAGSVAGAPLTNDGWTYFFNVDAPADSFEIFEAGDVAGDPLAELDSPTTRCLINKYKPAHSYAYFTFTGV